METKTAKDLPPGSDVYGQCATWTKKSATEPGLWLSDDGYEFNDGQIDLLLGRGATIVFIPAGRGQLLAENGEVA